MPELRKDPILGRWVIIAQERGKRPNDFLIEEFKVKGGFCPLCPGNEKTTPDEVLVYGREWGYPNTAGWQLRVVPNKYPALIIEGKPADAAKWYSLQVGENGVTIKEESEVVGLGNFAVIEKLNQRINDKVGVISIGPAGEMQMLAANISVKDPDNHVRSCGRGGLGAVMGSKRIKFIAVEPTDKKVEIAEPEAFKAANRAFAKALVDNPISKALAQYGTNVLVNIINESGGLPTRNFTAGQFEGHEAISGETMHDTIVARGGKPKHNCHPGCVI